MFARRDGRAGPQDETGLVRALPAAMANGQILPFYQPQFACADNGLIGAEALARWKTDDGPVIRGGAIFAAARRAGLAALLSRTIVERALAEAAQWGGALTLAVNVSPSELDEATYGDWLIAAMDRASLDPSRLFLEITEEAPFADIESARSQLDTLRGEGVRIALDDFGAGCSNLDRLAALNPDLVKLDQSLVAKVASEPRAKSVLRSVLAIATAYGVPCVAEGIETEGQRLIVGEAGCSAYQGFLGGDAIPARALEALLERD